jgi:hypothetical protein
MSPGSTTLASASEAPTDRLDTLPAWPWDPLDPSAPHTLGWGVAHWLETWLRQPNGPRAGQKFRLTPHQLRFLLWWYALDGGGRWLFDHGARRLAKGSGKSPFAGGISLAEFCGPVRLARKDDRLPGGVAGRPVDMPLIQIAATAESQTKNTMRMVRAFAPKGSDVVVEYQLDPGKTVYYKVPEGSLEVITSSVTASEGAESSLVVADETEHWKPSNQGPELQSTLEDNLAKSGSRMLETSNAWHPGIGTVAEDTWDAWVLQEEGHVRERGGRILYDAVIAPPDTDLADYDSLRSALEWVYGDCPWVDIDVIIRRIWSPRAKPSESKRKYLNWPTAPEEAWIEPEDWTKLPREAPDGPVEPGNRIAMFFDGSKSRDATALIGCRISDGHVFTLGVWERPQNADEDWQVDAGSVDSAVVRAFDEFKVAAFFADVREWESWSLSEWPNRYGVDLDVWAVPNGKPPQAVAWDMRANVLRFAEAAEACRADIIDDAFTHDHHPATARHVFNLRNREYHGRMSVGKESPGSAKKIDAGVCVIGVRMVRRLVMAAEAKGGKKKPGRVRGGSY